MPKIYSQDLINNLFKHPYTKIDFVVQDLQVSRQTASKYLDKLVEIGLLNPHKFGKEKFYINTALHQYLFRATDIHKFKRNQDEPE